MAEGSTETVYRNLKSRSRYAHLKLIRTVVFSTETVGKVGTWYWYFGKHNTYHTTSVQVFSSVIPTIPTIPRYFEISIPTIPARSGIFRCHTCDTRNTPVFWYLPYQLDQVFSNAIPTIPTRTVVWDTPGIYRGNPGKYPTRCTTN